MSSNLSNINLSIIGKPNSGKSTLFNLITKSKVLSKNMLFASLDSTIRNGYINGFNLSFIDTVGFIRDLPTTLIDSFKSTLNEIINSDLILHVRDISDSEYFDQKNEVLRILEEMKDFNCTEFNIGDIVRSGFVRDYLIQKTKLGIGMD